MTRKRFKYHMGLICEKKDGEYNLLTIKEVTDLLNAFNDENEQLKSEYKVLHTQYQDLKKFVENNFDEHLTQEKLNRQIIKLSDENEQLKKALCCIRKRYDCSIEEFVEDLKDNGIDLTKVDLE